MSAAATSPNITPVPHTPHTAHPIPLREHAFSLHCQGLRSPAIAAELSVPERTIRAWIAAALDELKDDLQLNRKEQLLLAVERQNAITLAAWQQFECEVAARAALLDAALEALHVSAVATDDAARSVNVRLPASTPAPRYLSLILQANKETNRLLGLHTLAKLQFLTTDTPETDPVPLVDSNTPAESATDTPAKSATVASSILSVREGSEVTAAAEERIAAGIQPANPHLTIPSPSRETASVHDILADSATDADPSASSALNLPAPAESATAFATSAFRPAHRARAFQGHDSSHPAKSATAPSSAGISQHSRRSYLKPQPWMM